MPNINDMITERASLVVEARKILDTADAEKRELSAEENAGYEARMADVDALGGKIKREEELRKVEAANVSEHFRKEAGAPEAAGGELRSFLQGKTDAKHFDVELRDQSKGTATSGGNTVPTDFLNTLYTHLVEMAAVRELAAVITTESGSDLPMPTTTAFGAATLHAEAATITTSDTSFGLITMKAYKYASIINVSRELIADGAFNIEAYLGEEAGIRLGNGAGTHFVTGDNSAKPQGVIAGATVGVTSAGTNVITTDELIDLYHSVVTGYRKNGTWLMNDATVANIRKKKGTANDHYLWQPGLALGQPDLLLGRPVVTDANVATLLTGAKVIAFGDFKRAYVIRDVAGVRIDRSDDFKFDTDMVSFKVVLRTDGRTRDAGAVKVLRNA